MTGRPARGIVNRVMREMGPIGEAPAFPLAAGALAPLRAKAETAGSSDFSSMWSGQAAALGAAMPAGALTREARGRGASEGCDASPDRADASTEGVALGR